MRQPAAWSKGSYLQVSTHLFQIIPGRLSVVEMNLTNSPVANALGGVSHANILSFPGEGCGLAQVLIQTLAMDYFRLKYAHSATPFASVPLFD